MTNLRRARIVSPLAIVLVALTAFCSVGLFRASASEAQVSALPIDFSDVVVFGTNSVRLWHHTQIVAGHVVVNNASPGPTLGSVELDIDRNVITPAGYAIVADSIDVANFAVVNGNAFYNTLSNSGTINGSLNTPLSLPVFTPLPPFQAASPGTLDVTVPDHQVQTLAPGNYRDIVVQEFATLKFSPGVYNIRSISTGRNVKLLFQNLTSGTADVRVQNQVIIGNFCVVGPDDGDPLKASKIIFYVGFTSGTNLTPPAFSVGNNTALKANVYTPNGTLRLNDHVTATGAFLGRDVHIDHDTQIDLETFFAAQAPTITSANATTFTVGQAGSFTVTTTGTPPPSIMRSGALPSGVTFVDNGDGTGTLSGTPAAGTGGTYPITFTASNGTPPDAVQNFTLTVNQAPAITSANATTFMVGSAGTFTVTTSGFPAPSISRGGAAMPAGVTFVDNGNGTGTLSGTPAAGTGGTYAITFTATNAAGSSPTQSFTLTVNQAPTITSANTVTFTVGQAGTFTVTTTGFPAPSIARGGVALPAGVSFVDNGNGTGTLSGTPAAGTGGTYAITFTATNAAGSSPTQNFTLVVNQAPAITSANATTFVVGQAGSFTVTTTGFPPPSIARGGVALPPGVTFVDNGNGTGTLSGTPDPGTGGIYAITFTATNAAGSSPTQNFTLTVNQAPAITSANATAFTVGQPGSFTVTTTGFPTPSITRGGAALPTGVNFVDNGNGTGTLSGTPGAGTGGSYALSFTASNGVPPPAVQNPFTLTVNDPPAAVADGPYLTDANTPLSRATSDPDDLLDNDYRGFPLATITSFGGGSLGGTVTSNAAGVTATFGTGGSLTVQSNGAFTFTPSTGFTGVFTFQYRLTNSGGTSDATVTINVRPKAANDTFPENVVGNVFVDTSTGSVFSVLGNDVFNTPVTATLGSPTSANGGDLTLNSSTGTFTYNPPVGFEGADSFTYTITDASGFTSAPATVSLTVSGMIWFVDNTAPSCVVAGCGRLTNPFSLLAAFNAVNDGSGNHPAANDNVFVYTGSGNYTGPLTMLNSQRVIGQGATSSLATLAGVTVPSGSTLPATGGTKPSITTVAGNGINLASGNQLYGLAFTNTVGAAIRGAVNIGTFTMADVAISNTTGAGISLTNGGTATATGINTIATTASTALNVVSTTIGAGHLTFRSISSGSAVNSTANGIVLDTTGSVGGLHVTGTGTAGSGGTIQHKTGSDGSTTQGTGIYLNNTSDVQLAFMQLNDFQNHGIRGTNVTGFTLANTVINGVNGTSSAGGSEEGAIRFDGLFGRASIAGSTLGGTAAADLSFSDDLRITNSSGTLDRLTIANTSFGKIGTSGNNALTVSALGTATLNLTVTGSAFTNAIGSLATIGASNSATVDAVIRGNAFSNDNPNQASGGGGLVIQGGAGTTNVTYDVSNNTFRDAVGLALAVATGNGGVNWTGTIAGNVVGVSGVSLSGSTQAAGIKVKATGTGTHTTLIANNTVHQTNEEGIFVQNNDGSATLNASLFGNVVDQPGPFSFAGLNVDAGALGTDTSVINVIIGSATDATQKNDFSAGDPFDFSDVNFSTIGGAVINLSKAGSASATVAGVIDDDNLNPAATNTADFGTINLVTANTARLMVTPKSVLEDGSTNVAYTFLRYGDTASAQTVNFSVGGSASFGTDYTQSGATTFGVSSGSVTFAAGRGVATVTVDPTADAAAEPGDTVTLTLTAGGGYTAASPSTATATILNDD